MNKICQYPERLELLADWLEDWAPKEGEAFIMSSFGHRGVCDTSACA